VPELFVMQPATSVLDHNSEVIVVDDGSTDHT
jgi:glycosyltransferase involved in cell wall biosynthesis